jgi:peptidyl-prolyl cis-trans isomerase C
MYEVRASLSSPPTKAELDEIRKLHWTELDHDDAVVTVHAVAIADVDDAQARARAKEVATKVLEAVRGATSVDEFVQRANTVDHGSLDLRVEPLPAVTREGRVLSADGGEFDAAFARGACELKQPGEISGLIETKFGFHVVRLSERIPAMHPSDDELSKLVSDEVKTNRTRAAIEKLQSDLRKQTGVEIERSFEQTLTRLDRSGP